MGINSEWKKSKTKTKLLTSKSINYEWKNHKKENS